MARKKRSKKINILSVIILMILIVLGYINIETGKDNNNAQNTVNEENITFDMSTIPEYSEEPYVTINKNIPYFTKEDYTTNSFERYSELDSLGRCGVAFANICKEIMPKEGDEREDISSVKPTGWKQKKYDGQYLYNRCHLIGYQLSNENANKQNLITGTEYLNIEGMLPFENKVAKYIEENPNNHVLYRVTPVFESNNLLASGVEIEAWSIEDEGRGICFNVYCYNIQPGIEIDYSTGESYLK